MLLTKVQLNDFLTRNSDPYFLRKTSTVRSSVSLTEVAAALISEYERSCNLAQSQTERAAGDFSCRSSDTR